MIIARAFAGKHYAVLGLARSGLATVEALLASGARVTAWDDDAGAREALASSPAFAGEVAAKRTEGSSNRVEEPLRQPAAATSPANAGEDANLPRIFALRRVAGLEAGLQRLHPLGRRAVGEIVGRDAALRELVVADRLGSAHPFLDIASLEPT